MRKNVSVFVSVVAGLSVLIGSATSSYFLGFSMSDGALLGHCKIVRVANCAFWTAIAAISGAALGGVVGFLLAAGIEEAPYHIMTFAAVGVFAVVAVMRPAWFERRAIFHFTRHYSCC